MNGWEQEQEKLKGCRCCGIAMRCIGSVENGTTSEGVLSNARMPRKSISYTRRWRYKRNLNLEAPPHFFPSVFPLPFASFGTGFGFPLYSNFRGRMNSSLISSVTFLLLS